MEHTPKWLEEAVYKAISKHHQYILPASSIKKEEKIFDLFPSKPAGIKDGRFYYCDEQANRLGHVIMDITQAVRDQLNDPSFDDCVNPREEFYLFICVEDIMTHFTSLLAANK